MSEKKIKHLEMIESIIERMAKNSFQLKSWTMTLVSLVGALAAYQANKKFILLAYIPIIGFWLLDAYYIKQGRIFSQLYENVASKREDDINFSMDTDSLNMTKGQKKRTKFFSCLISISVICFYPIIALSLIAVVVAIKFF